MWCSIPASSRIWAPLQSSFDDQSLHFILTSRQHLAFISCLVSWFTMVNYDLCFSSLLPWSCQSPGNCLASKSPLLSRSTLGLELLHSELQIQSSLLDKASKLLILLAPGQGLWASAGEQEEECWRQWTPPLKWHTCCVTRVLHRCLLPTVAFVCLSCCGTSGVTWSEGHLCLCQHWEARTEPHCGPQPYAPWVWLCPAFHSTHHSLLRAAGRRALYLGAHMCRAQILFGLEEKIQLGTCCSN